jgi:hypothetical protein
MYGHRSRCRGRGVIACDMRGVTFRNRQSFTKSSVSYALVGTDCLGVSAQYAVKQSQRIGPLGKAIRMAYHDTYCQQTTGNDSSE